MRIVPAEMVENAKTRRIENNEDMGKYLQVINDLVSLAKETNGVGLSCIQVGLPLNLFVAYNQDKKVWRAYFNANYCPVKESKTYQAMEGCLTYPNEQYMLNRFDTVYVEWEELKNGILVKRGKQFFNEVAQVLQHETDHGNGITIKMIGKKMGV